MINKQNKRTKKSNKVTPQSIEKTLEFLGDICISDLINLPKSRQEALSSDVEFYFNGSCAQGHLSPKSTKFNRCVVCMKDNRKSFYADNSGEIIKKNIAYQNIRYVSDPSFKAKRFVRYLLDRVLSYAKLKKDSSTEHLLGYTAEQFRINIESKFLEGMSWENHGVLWELDHTKPVALFKIEGNEDVKIVNSLDNLVPMWKTDHLEKTKNDNKLIQGFKVCPS